MSDPSRATTWARLRAAERESRPRRPEAVAAMRRRWSGLPERVRVYAELRQLIDVAIAAAYIQQQDFYGQAAWEMPVLLDESKVSVETYTAPERVETAVNEAA